MHQAIQLAKRGQGFTSPNPLVGAIIVKNGRIVGKGYHQKAGQAHAEVVALQQAGEQAKDATLYVNLEPCAHFGKTPPCTKALISAGLKRVVIATQDPNPLVDGKGIEELKQHGIQVEVGLLAKRATHLNEVFFTNCLAGRPFIALKSAATLDGKTALPGQERVLITNERSRTYSRTLRGFYDAVMVGINTLLKDDPDLTPRLERFKTKGIIRVICDTYGQTPPTARIFQGLPQHPIIVAVSKQARAANLKRLSKAGARVLLVEETAGKLELDDLIQKLYNLGISSIFVEGGSILHTSFFCQGLFDKFYLFLAPRFLGGENPASLIRGCVASLKDAPSLVRRSLRFFDEDLMLELYPAGTMFV